MASDNESPAGGTFDRWLQIELRSWGSRQDLPRSLRSRLLLRARELLRPNVNALTQARLSDLRTKVDYQRSLVLARLVEPTLELNLLSLRWVS